MLCVNHETRYSSFHGLMPQRTISQDRHQAKSPPIPANGSQIQDNEDHANDYQSMYNRRCQVECKKSEQPENNKDQTDD